MKIHPTRKSIKGHYGKKGRTVYVHTGIWHNKETGEIHISGPTEEKLISTVSNKKGLRYHPNLYKKLKKILKRESCW
ncbi:MAG: hypothetical protein ISS45_05875 [Candidatus Omnitrophica bacterium]|nr:hypothetical protein [Candidatus Omnitrophota bacterium]